MRQDEITNLSRDIEAVSSNFEHEPWTDNLRLLRKEFDIASISTPFHYSKIMNQLTEISRQNRVLFLYSVFSRVCKEEAVNYEFSSPYQAGMKYSAVMKKEDVFYILDEDRQYREIFTTENFARFVDNEYWELIERSYATELDG